MLTNSDLCYCENKCFEIIRRAKSKKEAKKRIMAFSYKGVSLNSNQTNNIIDAYISEFGSRYLFKKRKK